MIENARLISYTSPQRPDGRGDYTGGTTTAMSDRVCVDKPSSKQLRSRVDLAAVVTAVMFVERLDGFDVGGRVTYRLDGMTADRTMEIAVADPNSHGHQSHSELLLRSPR